MNADFVNAFVDATTNVLGTMASLKCVAGKPHLKPDKLTWGVVTGIIGMGGEKVNGNMIVSFEESCILKVVSAMLMEEFPTVTPEVVDAVGEITNMICGGAKSKIAEKGYNISMATPIMIAGKGVEVVQFSKSPVIVIPFKTDSGGFVVEANIAPQG